MKQVLAYIFILIFSFQVLPVKEIGKILFKGQITEEEVHGYGHNCDDNCPVKLKKEGDPFHSPGYYTQNHSRIIYLSHKLHVAIHEAEKLPSHFVPDILTPPPLCS